MVLESSYGNMSAHKKFQLKAQSVKLELLQRLSLTVHSVLFLVSQLLLSDKNWQTKSIVHNILNLDHIPRSSS